MKHSGGLKTASSGCFKTPFKGETEMRSLSCTKTILVMAVAVFFTTGILPLTALAEGGQSPWLMRVRLLGVVPDDSSSEITVIGGRAEVDDSVTVDLDFAYFFTKNFAAELTLAVAKNDVNAVHTAVGDVELGHVYLLPPTLTAQYHFIPDGKFRPYVGAGINYTVFFNEDSGPVANAVDYDNAFGWALQAGFDIGLNANWALNFDVKKLWLNTDVAVHALGTTVTTDVDIDPWLFGFGVAYRF
jgi:outer membrane protein